MAAMRCTVALPVAALAGLCLLHGASASANATCCECALEQQDEATEKGSVAFAFAMCDRHLSLCLSLYVSLYVSLPPSLSASLSLSMSLCLSLTSLSLTLCLCLSARSVGAGMCTTIGGAFAFLGKIEDTRILACSLAVSAGVMIYVSFIEIFVKSLGGFTDQFILDGMEQGTAERNAYYAATGFFFLGMLLTKLLDVGLEVIQAKAAEESIVGAEGLECCDGPPGAVADAKAAAGYGAASDPDTLLEGCTDKGCAGCLQLPGVDKLMAKYDVNADGALDMTELKELIEKINTELKTSENTGGVRPAEAAGGHGHGGAGGELSAAEAARLQQMGMFTALSIFIHNFPEGLATFIATLADPAAGAALAVAIGMHNIPEGICVGFPIFYATGSRWKAFWVSFLSGVSEPIGGLVGYFLMVVMSGGGDIQPLAYGIMFGIVAGMMVYIVIAHVSTQATCRCASEHGYFLTVCGVTTAAAGSAPVRPGGQARHRLLCRWNGMLEP